MKSAAHAILFAISTWFSLRASGEPAPAPNLIIILTEEQGYHDVGFNGCKDIPTPNLDSIASNGVRFTSGYISSPLSSPSRAGLMTGKYQERFGYERNPEWQPNNPDSGLPSSESTLADLLGNAGYETGMIGKWHLGSSPAKHPLNRGFKEFFGFLGAGHRYLQEELTIEDPRKTKTEYDSWLLWITRDRQPVRITNYLTDEFSDHAVSFIARHKEQPFFLFLSYNAPQAPLEAPEKYLSRFPQILSPRRRKYAAMISAVDDGVGRVLKELRACGLEERTLVVYLSASDGGLDANSSDNYPLRGYKNNVWEGCWRVPFAMQLTGVLPKGLIYNQPVLSLDIFATIQALAKAHGNPEVPLDGVDLVPYLTGAKLGAPHDSIYLRLSGQHGYAIRRGDFKLVVTGPNKSPELYNLSRDISEMKNLAELKPDLIRELALNYAGWSSQMKATDFTQTTEPNLPQPIDTEAEGLKNRP